ncbi:MAG: DUF1330 domain-containing protein [Candidatus Acidiferrum sp.]|jgi:uncharacterized protein (DUF1330 family)
MPAYIVFTRLHTRNRTELDLYAKEAATFFTDYKVKFLSRFEPCEMTEGPGVEGVAILEFPTMTEAKAWYNSPVYQKSAQTPASWRGLWSGVHGRRRGDNQALEGENRTFQGLTQTSEKLDRRSRTG